MTTREFAACISELNQQLKQFLTFEDNQDRDEDEIIDILQFGIPQSWQNKLVPKRSNPMESTLAELVVDFCERHEFTRGTKTNNAKISKGTTSSDLGKSQQQ